ncbi:unnamed protein product [Sphenostylis stenocarpa]|uniref:Uncharacterized protein n=1 Tax=Sphenostylis stenocarpa TaxID=92480 RepID=A0AA86VJN5_9FABA|nr:unnamed protein product [Sphenostylis stenocarpa]
MHRQALAGKSIDADSLKSWFDLKTQIHNMAEAEKESDSEIDRMEECEGEENDNGGALSDSHMSNASLAELNMLLVLLSLFYFSKDECIECEESEQKIIKDEVAATRTCISRLRSKKRARHEPKLGKKPVSSRFQTSVKDSRHGRKM